MKLGCLPLLHPSWVQIPGDALSTGVCLCRVQILCETCYPTWVLALARVPRLMTAEGHWECVQAAAGAVGAAAATKAAASFLPQNLAGPASAAMPRCDLEDWLDSPCHMLRSHLSQPAGCVLMTCFWVA